MKQSGLAKSPAWCACSGKFEQVKRNSALLCYSARSYVEQCAFPLAPHIQHQLMSNKSDIPMAHQLHTSVTLPITALHWARAENVVVVVTQQPGCLLVCRTNWAGRKRLLCYHRRFQTLGDVSKQSSPVLCVSQPTAEPIHCAAVVGEESSAGRMMVKVIRYRIEVVTKAQMWCGSTNGTIGIYKIRIKDNNTDKVSATASLTQTVNHYTPAVDGVDVRRCVTSGNDLRYCWTYVYPGKRWHITSNMSSSLAGSTLYQWHCDYKTIVSKLDVSKIMPCSESISTMIEIDADEESGGVFIVDT